LVKNELSPEEKYKQRAENLFKKELAKKPSDDLKLMLFTDRLLELTIKGEDILFEDSVIFVNHETNNENDKKDHAYIIIDSPT
jgi:hypothetical protein